MTQSKIKPIDSSTPAFILRMASSKIGALASNWVFQGMRYMQWHERALKLGTGGILAAGTIALLEETSLPVVLEVLCIVHTLNWLLNGQFFVLARYLHPVPNAPARFDEYVELVHAAAMKNPAVDGLAVFGSYCRGAIHEHSDLDVRVIASPGVLGGFRGAWFCMRLRFEAFFRRFPLDVYSFTDMVYLDRLREDERPIILLDRRGGLQEKYR
jgi:predicted nucleotidyltransferase